MEIALQISWRNQLSWRLMQHLCWNHRVAIVHGPENKQGKLSTLQRYAEHPSECGTTSHLLAQSKAMGGKVCSDKIWGSFTVTNKVCFSSFFLSMGLMDLTQGLTNLNNVSLFSLKSNWNLSFPSLENIGKKSMPFSSEEIIVFFLLH